MFIMNVSSRSSYRLYHHIQCVMIIAERPFTQQQHRNTDTPKADRSSHQRVVKTICTISRQINYYRRTILEMCVSIGTIKICMHVPPEKPSNITELPEQQ